MRIDLTKALLYDLFDSKAQQAHRQTPYVEAMKENSHIPMIAVTVYLVFVYYGPKIMEKRAPINCKAFQALWNLLLAVFSICGAYVCIPAMYNLLRIGGIWGSMCDKGLKDDWYEYQPGYWLMLFTWSKIPELFDTFFLVVQKKPVVLLQWYHHATVLPYCWLTYIDMPSAGMYFASMNYSVHAVMYTYFFFMCFQAPRPICRVVAPYITIMQILQMAVGLFIGVYTFYMRRLAATNLPYGGCHTTDFNNIMCLGIYTSYLVLFAKLFIDSRAKRRDSKPKAE